MVWVDSILKDVFSIKISSGCIKGQNRDNCFLLEQTNQVGVIATASSYISVPYSDFINLFEYFRSQNSEIFLQNNVI